MRWEVEPGKERNGNETNGKEEEGRILSVGVLFDYIH